MGKQPAWLQRHRYGQPWYISHHDAMAKIAKLKAVTVEHGATPAEAAAAALISRRLMGRIGRHGRAGIVAHAGRPPALAPGVHVSIGS